MKMWLTGTNKVSGEVLTLIPTHDVTVSPSGLDLNRRMDYAVQQRGWFIYSDGESTWYIDTNEFHTLKLTTKAG